MCTLTKGSLILNANNATSGKVISKSPFTIFKFEDDIGFSYELGLCSTLDSIGTTGRSDGAALAAARRLILDDGALLDTTKQIAGAAKDIGTELLSDTEANRDMIYLGGATTFLVVAATAVGMLSHHLTVNVFWV